VAVPGQGADRHIVRSDQRLRLWQVGDYSLTAATARTDCSDTTGMIFLSNEAFPLIFGPGNNGHDWDNTGLVNLTFGAYVVGAVMSVPKTGWYPRHVFVR
jgi:hypothetical protein